MKSAFTISLITLVWITGCQRNSTPLSRQSFQTKSQKNLEKILNVYSRAFTKQKPARAFGRFGTAMDSLPDSAEENYSLCWERFKALPKTSRGLDYIVAMVTADRCMRNNMRLGSYVNTWGYQEQGDWGQNQNILSYISNPNADYGYQSSFEDDLFGNSMFNGF